MSDEGKSIWDGVKFVVSDFAYAIGIVKAFNRWQERNFGVHTSVACSSGVVTELFFPSEVEAQQFATFLGIDLPEKKTVTEIVICAYCGSAHIERPDPYNCMKCGGSLAGAEIRRL